MTIVDSGGSVPDNRIDISKWCAAKKYQFAVKSGLSLKGAKCQWQKNLAEILFLKAKAAGVELDWDIVSKKGTAFDEVIEDIEKALLKKQNIYVPDGSSSSSDVVKQNFEIRELTMENLLKNQGVSENSIKSIKDQKVLSQESIDKILKYNPQPHKWMQEIRTILEKNNESLTCANFETVFDQNVKQITKAQKDTIQKGELPEKVIKEVLDKNPDIKAKFTSVVNGIIHPKKIIHAKKPVTSHLESSKINTGNNLPRQTPRKLNENTGNNSSEKVQVQIMSVRGDKSAKKLNENLLGKFLTLHDEVDKKGNISSELAELLTKPLAEQNKSLSNAVNLLTNRKEKLELKLNNLTESALNTASEEADQNKADKFISALLEKLFELETAEEKIKYLETLLGRGKGTKTM